MSRNTEAHNDHTYECVKDKNKYGRPIEICLYKKIDTIYVTANDTNVIALQMCIHAFALWFRSNVLIFIFNVSFIYIVHL